MFRCHSRPEVLVVFAHLVRGRQYGGSQWYGSGLVVSGTSDACHDGLVLASSGGLRRALMVFFLLLWWGVTCRPFFVAVVCPTGVLPTLSTPLGWYHVWLSRNLTYSLGFGWTRSSYQPTTGS